jgi:hypothetical protein
LETVISISIRILPVQPGVGLFDVLAWFQEVIADPAMLSTGGDDDEFLFWDAVHPTADGAGREWRAERNGTKWCHHNGDLPTGCRVSRRPL